jgi:tartrate dehydratase beta subunit/fumarate hydratase class I family protein
MVGRGATKHLYIHEEDGTAMHIRTRIKRLQTLIYKHCGYLRIDVLTVTQMKIKIGRLQSYTWNV